MKKKKPDTKYNFIYMTFKNKQNSSTLLEVGRVISWVGVDNNWIWAGEEHPGC